jgi:hypothetical protein
MRAILILWAILFICPFHSLGQENAVHRSKALSIDFRFWQFKDSMNYGLVYSGPGLAIGYEFEYSTSGRTFIYSPEVNLGVNFNKGIGVAYGGSPADLYYGYEVLQQSDKRLTIGPYTSLNYNWQLYPELQSGHMFWFTTLEVGPRAILTMPIKKKPIRFDLAFSVFGWASRPALQTETHFYSLRFKDYVHNAHQDWIFGSSDLFTHVDFGLELLSSPEKRLSVGYGFQLFGYYKAPSLEYLDHSISLKWKLGKL